MSDDEGAKPAPPGHGSYWWCLTHERVEPYEGCANSVRLGPYPTADDAQHAIEKAHERTREWDQDED